MHTLPVGRQVNNPPLPWQAFNRPQRSRILSVAGRLPSRQTRQELVSSAVQGLRPPSKSAVISVAFTASRSGEPRALLLYRRDSFEAVDIFALCSPILPYMSRYDRPSHRVFMTFFYRKGWQVQFMEADLETPLPRTFTFADAEKIRELARRGEAMGTLEARQSLEHAVETGRGGVYLKLTPAQHAKLKRL
jgi:hypothetical protein